MRVAVFSGTSEGKKICEYLNKKGITVKAFVATEYGKSVMKDMKYVSVSVGRLCSGEMKEAVFSFDVVIDATHPFAKEATKNIKYACSETKTRYIRLLRDNLNMGKRDGAIFVKNAEQAAEILKGSCGNIFISTGGKELHKYCVIDDYKKRIVVRLLPVEESEEKAKALGLERVILERGPFSYEDNIKAFRRYDIKWLVTKDSGKAGGFFEKIKAAEDMGINIIVIERPLEKEGLSFDEVVSFFEN